MVSVVVSGAFHNIIQDLKGKYRRMYCDPLGNLFLSEFLYALMQNIGLMSFSYVHIPFWVISSHILTLKFPFPNRAQGTKRVSLLTFCLEHL